MSLAEDTCYKSVQQILKGHITRNYRPKWLINPKTGARLEIDIWIKEYKIGIEVQGPHHLFDDYQREKDQVKRDTFNKLGFTLIELGTSEVSAFKLKSKLKSLDRNGKKPFVFRRTIYIKAIQGKTREGERYDKKSKHLYGPTSLNPEDFESYIESVKKERDFIREANTGRPLKFKLGDKEVLGRIYKTKKRTLTVIHGGEKIKIRREDVIKLI